ncbi:DUF1963 domain-containing protein [uncultured Roseovarius sp.]|uniref:DUF1963 domain-containing protein n=1 Tax=uncultured Roseovarius sp. TaxID=293344 RepID=UPI0025ECDCAB|nr:DUF1963 domain-containing protein [uncultured Roseovarius sp.]
MILDRYYQIAAGILAFILFREHMMTAVAALLPFLFLAIPLLIVLLLRQSIAQTLGRKQQRSLLRLRWTLSHQRAPMFERRRDTAAKAVITAYNLAPQAGLPEQAKQIAAMMQETQRINRAYPPILQRRLTADTLGKALAEAAGLTGAPRTALIDALRKAVRETRHRGWPGRIKARLRALLSPLAGTSKQRRRIGVAFYQTLLSGQAQKNARLLALCDLIQTTRRGHGLSQNPDNPLDPIEGLPLRVQRRIVLFSELAFGTANIGRIAWTDPSQIKTLRQLKDRLDDAPVPDPRFWDATPTNDQPKPAPQTTQPATPASEDDLRDMVTDSAVPALLLKRAWPIGEDVEGRSWLGGCPLLPTSMEWPKRPETGQPLHFLAQIDCADLPRIAGGEALPNNGLLLFFAFIDEEMLWDDETGSGQVLYVPPQIVPEQPAKPPRDLPDLSYTPGQLSGSSARAGIRGYPRWPVTIHETLSFQDNDLPPAGLQIAGMAQMDALKPHFPEPVETTRNAVFQRIVRTDPETGEPLRNEKGGKLYEHVVAPDLIKAGFPFCGAVMSRFATRLENSLVQKITLDRWIKQRWQDDLQTETEAEAEHLQKCIDKITTDLGEMSDGVSRLQKISAALNAWDDYEKPSDNASRQFAAWLTTVRNAELPALEGALRGALKSVAQQAVTDPQMRAILPQALFDFFESDLRPNPDQSQHMMLGHPQFKTNSTAGPGIRLLSLDSDSGLDFEFCDCGMAEFWIDPEDLARRDFSKVLARTAGG